MKRWLSCWPLLLASCVTGEYNQVTFNEPIDRQRLLQLQPGKDDLTSCLAALGAPVDVREYAVDQDRNSGMALIWFWTSQVGWGAKASSVFKDASVSFEFDFTGTDLPGCVVWFDSDLKLESYREGLVGALLRQQRRPSPTDA